MLPFLCVDGLHCHCQLIPELSSRGPVYYQEKRHGSDSCAPLTPTRKHFQYATIHRGITGWRWFELILTAPIFKLLLRVCST